MREELREIGRSMLDPVKWLLGSTLIHAAIVAGVLLIAATAFVTAHVLRAWREQEPQQGPRLQPTDRDPEPPAPVS